MGLERNTAQRQRDGECPGPADLFSKFFLEKLRFKQKKWEAETS